MSFPITRLRRLRINPQIRNMVQEFRLHPSDFIAPVFVCEGENIQEEISSMPGYYRYSLDYLGQELEELVDAGIRSVLIFVKVSDNLKDNRGVESFNQYGLMQRTVRFIKEKYPEFFVMTDVALDPYSSYGHDGIVENGEIVNDPTIEVLVKMSLSHAEAGVDMVAPSDMMDGRIGAIRRELDAQGYINTGIMAYSAKYASAYYGPFRDALDSAPGFGDKKTYQMNPGNLKEAIYEAKLDVEEGADIVMVKPGLPYLDVVRAVADNVPVPVSVYHVSGEYTMLKAAAANGWLNGEEAMLEALLAFKRAGASLIATYFAKEAALLLKNKS